MSETLVLRHIAVKRPGLVRALAAGFTDRPNRKAYRADPAAYPGSITETSQVIRVLLAGSLRSPCLPEVADALGPEEVRLRACAVTGV